MDLSQWLEQIEAFHPDEIDLGLERITCLAKKLKLLDSLAKIITVGGTNGKGSTVATIESLALQSRLKVGCFTSPHLLRFNERVRVNGSDIDDESLVSSFEIIESARQSLSAQLGKSLTITFFEFTALAALLIFKRHNLDLIVLEVGLGGRLDAVNMLEADVAIVTTIARDHESWLGSSLKEIAYEKSGIFRKDIVNLVGDFESIKLITEARPDISSIVSLVDSNIESKIQTLSNSITINPKRLLAQNLTLAFTAFFKLFPSLFKTLDFASVIKNIQIKGRLQVIGSDPMITDPRIILDVAHNEQAAENLSSQLKSMECAGRRIAICGMMRDKSIDRFLAAMNSVIDTWIFTDLASERAISATELESICTRNNRETHVKTVSSVKSALDKVYSADRSNDHIIVTGSFITVADALVLLE